MTVDMGALLRQNFFEEEGDEWEPATSGVCRALEAQGLKVKGEDVRRAIREMGVQTRKEGSKLLIRSYDVRALIDFFMAKRSVAERGSQMGLYPLSGDRFGADVEA